MRYECVKKQPLLTDFPSTVFATAKRRLQAAIRQSKALLLRRSLSGYAVIFEDWISSDFLESIDPTQRQRNFGHIPLFWAWMAQILEGNASCHKAVSWLQAWSQAHGLPVPSSDTSSYCKARSRIRMSFLQSVHAKVLRTLRSGIDEENRWKGLNLKAIDGTSVTLMDTPANQKLYPQSSKQKPGCGFPTMGIVGLLDLGHGGLEHVVTCPWKQHDTKAASAIVPFLCKGDLLLADRAFSSFELIAKCQEQGAHVLIRLHQARHKYLDWRKGKRLGKHQRLVTWTRPRRPARSSLSAQEWEQLPEKMELRLIKTLFKDRAGKTKELIVVTTLTDHLAHDGMELANLYARRWDIELKFRDLKTTLKLETLSVKSPDLAHKTLLMSIIAINLLRGLMQKAATLAQKPVWQMSFKGCLDLVTASHEGFRNHAGRRIKKAAAFSDLLILCAEKIIDLRPNRHEPRALKRRPKNYQLLTKPRSIFREIPHRSAYKKPA